MSPRSSARPALVAAALVASALAVSAITAVPAHAGGLFDSFNPFSWKFDGPQPGDFAGSTVKPAGDVNGDGFGDVLVGTASEDTARVRAYLFLGGAGGLSLVPAWSYTTSLPDGGSVAPAGDVNGDGFADVAVGLPYWNSALHAGVGRVAIFHGSASGLSVAPVKFLTSPEPHVNQQFGFSVDTAGDVDNDGFDDLIVGAPRYSDGVFTARGAVWVYLGSASGLSSVFDTKLNSVAENGLFGWSVSTAGALDGDGYADVIVGAPQASGTVGAALVHVGSAGGILANVRITIAGEALGARTGTSVSTAGDVNGDGYPDVIVGSPGYQSSAGRARVSFGSNLVIDGGILLTNPAFVAGDNFGRHVATLGDLDGDGYADVGVSALGGGAGRISVYLGAKTGPAYVGEALPEESFHAQYGLTFASSGDVDGDGFTELLLGDPYAPTSGGSSRGRARLRTLRRRAPALSANWPRAGAEPGTRYGTGLAIVSGLDDDQYTRLVVGDPGHAGEGRVSMHLGVPTFGVDVDELPEDWDGFFSASSFGARVVDAGDVDRDGFSDFAVSAPTAPNDTTLSIQTGRVDLIRGASNGVYAKTTVLSSRIDFDRVGSALAGRGDVNGDGYHDLLVGAAEWRLPLTQYVGKVWLLYGGPGGLGATFWTRNGTEYGRGMGAGVALTDLDGDGYTDVIIGSSSPSGATPLEGRVEVHYGRPSGPAMTPGLVLHAPVPSPSFGSVVVALGDVNGDGIGDIGVGAPEENDGRGVARVYEGTAGRSQWPFPIKTIAGTQDGAHMGAAMAGGGDVDGDGFGDFVVGEPGWDAGITDQGRFSLYYGAPFVPEPEPGFIIDSGQLGAELGASFAPLRDVDGDGFADVIVGAPGQAGRVYAYLGGGGPGQRHELHLHDFTAVPEFERRFFPAWLDLDVGVVGLMVLRSPAGRTEARIDLEVRPQSENFTRTATAAGSAFNDTGQPGSETFFNFGFGDLPPGRGYHLRGRIATRSPYFPRSRWIAAEAHVTGDMDVHVGGAVVDAGNAPGAGLAGAGVPRLGAIAPNPARGTLAARVSFTLPRAARATLDLYDVRGARVRRLLDAALPAGTATPAWDGRDDHGRAVAPGLYFVELAAEGRTDQARIVRLP